MKQVAEGEPASVGGHMRQGLRVDAWPCTPRCVPAPQSAPNTTGRLRGCWMKAGVTISARRGPFRTNGSLLWPQGLIATVSHRCALDGCSELPDRCLREGHQREPGMGGQEWRRPPAKMQWDLVWPGPCAPKVKSFGPDTLSLIGAARLSPVSSQTRTV